MLWIVTFLRFLCINFLVNNKLFYFGVLPALGFQLVGAYLYFELFKGEDFSQTIYFVTKILLVIWPLLWLVAMKRVALPFWKGEMKKSVVWGVLSGVALFLLILGIYILFADYLSQFIGNVLEAAKNLNFLEHYILFSIFLSIVHSFIEEYYWRWFILNGLLVKVGKWAAMIIGSLAFASHHFIVVLQFVPLALAILATFLIFLLGMFWSYFYLKTKSIIGPWISHFFADAIIMGLGYFLIFN